MSGFGAEAKSPYRRLTLKTQKRLKNISFVAFILEALPGGKRRIGLKALLVFFLPSELALFVFFLSRQDRIAHGWVEILYVVLASLWFWLGPVLIWRYERVTLPTYWKCTRPLIPDRRAFFRYRARHKTALTRISLILLFSWSLAVCWAYFASFEFVRGFGFSTMLDPWWFLWMLGVAVWSFITGLGFSASIRTFFVCRDLARSDMSVDPWHEDGRGGLGYIGKLLAHTSLSLASGTLFLPILLTLFRSMRQAIETYSLALLIGIYALAILVSFLLPALIIHSRMVLEKEKVLGLLAAKRLSSLSALNGVDEQGEFYRQIILRKDIQAASSMHPWPFQQMNLVSLIGALVLPVLLFAIDKGIGKTP